MNHYQQNNVSVTSSIQVNFLSVTYINIVQDSNVHKLISRLQVAQKEFQKCISWEESGTQVKSKALELSSILEALMDASSVLPYESRREFCEKVVESACVVIEQYKGALSIEGFSEAIVNELFDYTQNFFEKHFGSSINDRFWFSLKCYEWFKKEGLISNRSYRAYMGRSAEYEYVFTEEQLERFFTENRKAILQIMLENDNNGYNHLIIDSPLENEDTNQSFRLYNRISVFQST